MLLIFVLLVASLPVPAYSSTNPRVTFPIIPYGNGEGNFDANGVGQTTGVTPNPLVGDYR